MHGWILGEQNTTWAPPNVNKVFAEISPKFETQMDPLLWSTSEQGMIALKAYYDVAIGSGMGLPAHPECS